MCLVCGIIDSIANKMCLVSKHGANHLNVRINQMAKLKPATHVRNFKMLYMLGMVRIQLICNAFHTLLSGKTGWAEILRVPLRGLCCTMSIFPVPRIFVVLNVQRGCFQSERARLLQVLGEKEWTYVGQGFIVEDIAANNLQLQQWSYVCNTRAQNAYRCLLHGKAACSLLLLTVHLSRGDLTALYAVSRTAGLRTWRCEDDFLHPLYFKCYYLCQRCQSDACVMLPLALDRAWAGIAYSL